jgi:hypothetical protein
LRLSTNGTGNTFSIGRYDDIITKNNKITVWNFSLMEWLKSSTGKIVAVLAPIVLALPIALAEEAKYVGEDYYGNDINAAVLEASQNKRQINHTHKNWYNRTTSRSFGLPPLQASDLEEERLEGALSATASGPERNPANPELPSEEQSEIIQKEDLTQDTQSPQTVSIRPVQSIQGEYVKVIPSIQGSHQIGDTSANTVSSQSIIVSTPRP